MTIVRAGGPSSGGDPLLLGGAFSFVPTSSDSTARAMANANEIVYIRGVGSGTFSSAAFRVVVSSGNVCIGVYADTLVSGVHQPGSRLATTGSVACPVAGPGSFTLGGSVSVSHGRYWWAFAADNTTATFVTQMIFPANDTAIYPGIGYSQAATFPLPTSAGTLTTTGKRVPLIRGV